jgi:hypothetical protein
MPAPVTTKARTASSVAAAWNIAAISAELSDVNGFFPSSRFRVGVATAPSTRNCRLLA